MEQGKLNKSISITPLGIRTDVKLQVKKKYIYIYNSEK